MASSVHYVKNGAYVTLPTQQQRNNEAPVPTTGSLCIRSQTGFGPKCCLRVRGIEPKTFKYARGTELKRITSGGGACKATVGQRKIALHLEFADNQPRSTSLIVRARFSMFMWNSCRSYVTITLIICASLLRTVNPN